MVQQIDAHADAVDPLLRGRQGLVQPPAITAATPPAPGWRTGATCGWPSGAAWSGTGSQGRAGTRWRCADPLPSALAGLGPGAAAVDPSHAVEVPLPGAGPLPPAFSGPFGPALVPARRSPGYARLEDACAVVLSGAASCPLELCSDLLPIPAGPWPDPAERARRSPW